MTFYYIYGKNSNRKGTYFLFNFPLLASARLSRRFLKPLDRFWWAFHCCAQLLKVYHIGMWKLGNSKTFLVKGVGELKWNGPIVFFVPVLKLYLFMESLMMQVSEKETIFLKKVYRYLFTTFSEHLLVAYQLLITGTGIYGNQKPEWVPVLTFLLTG